jgi:hypothetical protein
LLGGADGLGAPRRHGSDLAFVLSVDAADADGDGDGILDLLAGLDKTPEVALLRGDGAGRFAAPVRLAAVAGHVRTPALADLDGDAWPDLVATDVSGNAVGVVPDAGRVLGNPVVRVSLEP